MKFWVGLVSYRDVTPCLRLSDSDTEDPRRGCLRGGWGWGWSFKGLVDKEWRVNSWKVRWWFIHSYSCSHSLCHCKRLRENDVPSDIQCATIHFIISDNNIMMCPLNNAASKIRWNRIFFWWRRRIFVSSRNKRMDLCKWPSKGDFHGKICSNISSSNRYTDLVSFCTWRMGATKRSFMYSRAIFHFHDVREEEYNIEFTFFEPWGIRWKYVKVLRS